MEDINNTTSIQEPSITLSPFGENESVDLTLLNGEPTDALNQGQLVYLSGNNAVRKITLGTQYPLGVVKTGGLAGKKLAVQTSLCRDLHCIAKGGTIAAGAFVKPNGNLSVNGLPEVVAVAAGDYTQMVVLSGGAVDTQIRIGVLRVPMKTPAA